MLTLSDLFPDAAPGTGSRFVTGLAFDSRKVVEGAAFVAVPGAKADGSAFVADAVSRGAGAIVGAGSVVTQDVPADALALVRPAQVNKSGWAERFRKLMQAKKAAK